MMEYNSMIIIGQKCKADMDQQTAVTGILVLYMPLIIIVIHLTKKIAP